MIGIAFLAPFGEELQAQSNARQSRETVQSISASDKAQGAKAHPQLVAEFGGAMTGTHARYVEQVGHVAARHSAKRQSAATRNSILGALGGGF